MKSLKLFFATLLLFHISIFVELLHADQPVIVVAQDGSGQFKTIAEALKEVATQSGRIIHVKAGLYLEYVTIEAKNTTLIGDGMGKSIISGNKSDHEHFSILHSAPLVVNGDGFICMHLTIQNTAGPHNGQAVALLSRADHAVFFKCSIEGYQDTLLVDSKKQFFRECDIYGITDFIFGNAAAIFQNCNVYLRNPPNKIIYITAQGQNDSKNTGFSIQNSTVKLAPDFKDATGVKIYLGRPWRNNSRVVFMETNLEAPIDPAGWMDWDGRSRMGLLYYGEYKNTGPGSPTSQRVKWKGFKVIKQAVEASQFTVGKFIDGDTWLPATKVPYNSGL